MREGSKRGDEVSQISDSLKSGLHAEHVCRLALGSPLVDGSYRAIEMKLLSCCLIKYAFARRQMKRLTFGSPLVDSFRVRTRKLPSDTVEMKHLLSLNVEKNVQWY